MQAANIVEKNPVIRVKQNTPIRTQWSGSATFWYGWKWIRYFVALDFGNWSYSFLFLNSFLQWLSKKSFFAYYLMWVRVHQSLKVKVTNTVHIKVFLSALLVNGKIRIRTYGLGTPKNFRSGSGTLPYITGGMTALLAKFKTPVPFPVNMGWNICRSPPCFLHSPFYRFEHCTSLNVFTKWQNANLVLLHLSGPHFPPFLFWPEKESKLISLGRDEPIPL